MTELYRTYSAEKAAARLDAYGAPAVEGDAALYACALDCGLLTAAEAAALAESEAVTAEDATNLLALAVELSGKGRNFLGYSDDPDITQRIYNAWSNIPRYDNPELSDLGMQILLKGITSGYTLQYDAYEAQFLPELAMRYGQDDIKHAAQFVALLNSEDMVVKLQLLPKISVYEYLLEWGPIPEPTPTYEVRPVEDRWFVYTLEYDLQMEFGLSRGYAALQQHHSRIRQKNDDNAETQEGLIYSSWWQPLYTTELTNDMPVGAMTNTRSSQSCSSQTAAAIPQPRHPRHGDGSHRKRNQRPERKLHLHRFRGLEQRRVLSLPHGNGLSISSGPRNPGAVPTQAKPPVNRVVSVCRETRSMRMRRPGF